MRGMRTFECANCQARFGEPYGTGRPKACPKCRSQDFCRVAEERTPRAGDPRANPVAAPGLGRGRCCRRRAGWSRVVQASAGTPPAPSTRQTNASRSEDAS